ncbi:hypothetical protein [Azotobacter vinelandii]|uniref:hypothetical protein n=1 Tax=Azotobacter vinelandii TaxID=354 RepID=UPI0007734854|nr:hypothetical protein [Azotobacter vinelandii]WKN24145.1 hypothetical protein AVAEIV_002287 [Azotobacter vinelandii]
MGEVNSSPVSTEAFNLIVPLERKLKAHLRLLPDPHRADTWLLDVRLFYEAHPAGRTSFTLSGYSREEAEAEARNIRSNSYLMQEIDQYLWSEND